MACDPGCVDATDVRRFRQAAIELLTCISDSSQSASGDLQIMCDTQADGSVVKFIRVVYPGTPNIVEDYELDGITTYTPTGSVSVCACIEKVCVYTPGIASTPSNVEFDAAFSNWEGIDTNTVKLTLTNGSMSVEVVAKLEVLTGSLTDFKPYPDDTFSYMRIAGGIGLRYRITWTLSRPLASTLAIQLINFKDLGAGYLDYFDSPFLGAPDVVPAGFEIDGVVPTQVNPNTTGSTGFLEWNDKDGLITFTTEGGIETAAASSHSYDIGSLFFDALTEYTAPIWQYWIQINNADGTVSYVDETGTPQVSLPVGAMVVPCCWYANDDVEFKILCDVNGILGTTRFLRRYNYDVDGNVSTTDTTLDGVTPYSVTGEVFDCASKSIPATELESTMLTVVGDTTIDSGYTQLSLAITSGTADIDGATFPTGSTLNLPPSDGDTYPDLVITNVTGSVLVYYTRRP